MAATAAVAGSAVAVAVQRWRSVPAADLAGGGFSSGGGRFSSPALPTAPAFPVAAEALPALRRRGTSLAPAMLASLIPATPTLLTREIRTGLTMGRAITTGTATTIGMETMGTTGAITTGTTTSPIIMAGGAAAGDGAAGVGGGDSRLVGGGAVHIGADTADTMPTTCARMARTLLTTPRPILIPAMPTTTATMGNTRSVRLLIKTR